jgi:hypothetical protein
MQRFRAEKYVKLRMRVTRRNMRASSEQAHRKSAVRLARHATDQALIDEQIEVAPVAFAEIEPAFESEVDTTVVVPGTGAHAAATGLAAMDRLIPW